MRRYAFIWIIEIVLGRHTMRLTDGGFVRWGGQVFRARDPQFGAIGAVGNLSEGVGEEVPVIDMTLLPPSATAPSFLSQPGDQSAPARFWLGEVDIDAGTLMAEPELQFEGEIDQTTIEFGADAHTVAMTIVSAAARLLERSIGNTLSPSFHKSIWPGETGHDQATGIGRTVAWGVEAPRGGAASGGAYGGAGFIDARNYHAL